MELPRWLSPPVLQELCYLREPIIVRFRFVKGLQVYRVQGEGVLECAFGGARAAQEVSLYFPEISYVLAGELRRKLHGIVWVLHASASADDLQAFRRNAQPRAETADKERDLCTRGTPIEVRLVNDK